jgi:hypothetical protein
MPSAPEPVGYAGYQPYYEALRARGFSGQESKWLVLGRLETEARQRAAAPVRPYWQPSDVSQPGLQLRLFAEFGRARTALTEVFGAETERDPVFSILFQPLGPAFSFLTPAQQIDTQRLKLEQQRASAATASTMSSGAATFPRTAGAPGWTDFVSKLSGVLDEKSLLEYRLRDSPLAEQLRGSTVEYSEAEFRKTFEVLSRLEESTGDQELYASTRRALRDLLGGRRFALLWETRDPLFAVTKKVCEKHAIRAETISTVYELFNDSQDRVVEIVHATKGDPQRGAQSVREERAELERRLLTLVGDEVAQDIFRAQTQEILSLTKNRQLVPR